MKKVSVLGCGWLGLPFAVLLIKNGYTVLGSTKDPSKLDILRKSLIKPFLININPEVNGENIDEFFSSDTLFINFPPERRDDIVEYHKEQIKNLIKIINNTNIKNVIFASSTSVYPNTQDLVFEYDILNPEKLSGKALLEAERLLMDAPLINCTIVRFAGLIGYDRSPLNSIKRKKLVLNSHVPLNLIHRDDCIQILLRIITQNKWNEIYNACSDNHPTRKQYYFVQANKNNIDLPEFDDTTDLSYKIVDNSKLKKELNYNFIYPDPLNI